MTNLLEALNFSTKSNNPSAIKLHNRNSDYAYYYDNLCLYCANNDIDLSVVPDEDVNAAVEIMSEYGAYDMSTDHYYFWID